MSHYTCNSNPIIHDLFDEKCLNSTLITFLTQKGNWLMTENQNLERERKNNTIGHPKNVTVLFNTDRR